MKIIRVEEVMQRVQLSRSTIWRLEKAGKFPTRVRIGEKAMGWLEADIEQWLLACPRGTTTQPAMTGGDAVYKRVKR